jgi:hydrogenase nickel incorporation protein HypB
MILSTPEGADKPSKYPLIFQKSAVMLLNKIDLLPYLDFDRAKVRRDALALNRDITVFDVSCRTGEGLDGWFGWLTERIDRRAG